MASAADWQNRFQRKPNPGARPLVILRPFGPVAFVYELGDTEGKAFPKELAEPFSAEGMVSRAMVDSFIENMLFSGVDYQEQDYGSDSAGFVQWVGSRAVYTSPAGKKKHYSVPFGILNRGFDDQYYKDLIIKYLRKYGYATKAQIRELLLDKLPDSLNEQQKESKVGNLLTALRKQDIIAVVGHEGRQPLWALTKQNSSSESS